MLNSAIGKKKFGTNCSGLRKDSPPHQGFQPFRTASDFSIIVEEKQDRRFTRCSAHITEFRKIERARTSYDPDFLIRMKIFQELKRLGCSASVVDYYNIEIGIIGFPFDSFKTGRKQVYFVFCRNDHAHRWPLES